MCCDDGGFVVCVVCGNNGGFVVLVWYVVTMMGLWFVCGMC